MRASANPQLVILGARLDGRAWRMPEFSGVDVFEVDYPASQPDKREQATALHLTTRSLRFVPVDFTQAVARPCTGRRRVPGRDAPSPLEGPEHDESAPRGEPLSVQA